MSDSHEILITLLRQSRVQSNSGLNNFIGIPMGLALIFAPGLVLGAFLSKSSALLAALLLAVIFGFLFFLSKFLDGLDNKRFVRSAVENGIAETEAEVFLKRVNWDEVFPEYD